MANPIDQNGQQPPAILPPPPPPAPDASGSTSGSSGSNNSPPAPARTGRFSYQITPERMATIKKIVFGVIALLVVAAIGYGVHKTIGWQAVGERLSQWKDKSFAWLNSPSNLTNGKSMAFFGIPAIAAGAGLAVGGKKAYAKFQTWQANRQAV